MASAYADFMITVPTLDIGEPIGAIPGYAVPPEIAVQVENNAHPGAKMTKVTIITNQVKFARLQAALDTIGITGITVTNVHGYGMQKGHPHMYRGVKVETKLCRRYRWNIVICKVPSFACQNSQRSLIHR
jgi:Amt family ammonium transporter